MAASADRATFAYDLDATGVESAGKSAAAVLEALQQKLHGGIDELRGMQAAFRNLKGGAQTSAAALSAMKDKITAQKASIANLQSAYTGLGGSFRNVKKPSDEAGNSWKKLIAQAKGMPGPIGAIAGRFESLSKLVGGRALALGIIGIAAAMAVLVGAVAVGTAAMLRWGIAQADARRSELLHLQALTKIRFWWAGWSAAAKDSVTSGNFLQATIDKVSGSVALGRDAIAGYADQLYKMGLRGGNLQQALEGVAMTASEQGDGQAQIFASWAAGAAFTGQSVRRLADDVRGRLGPIAKAHLLSLDVQAQKLRENMALIFSGLKLDRLLEGVKKVADLFSQATFTGRALKAIVSGLFQPLIDSAGGGAPIVKRFLQGIVIGALGVTIALLTLRKWWRDVFGKGSQDDTGAMWPIVLAGVAAVGLLIASVSLLSAGIVGLGVAAIPILITLTTWLWSAAVAGLVLAAPFLLAAVAVAALGAAFYQAYKLWQEMDWSIIGKGIIDGLVGGLKLDGPFIDKMKGLAQRGWQAFKDYFDINSPSRRARNEGGRNIGKGVAIGVEDSGPEVQRAYRGLVQIGNGDEAAAGAAAGKAGAATGAPAAAPAAGMTVSVAFNAPVTLGGGKGGDDSRSLEDTFEGLAIMIGARVAAAVT